MFKRSQISRAFNSNVGLSRMGDKVATGKHHPALGYYPEMFTPEQGTVFCMNFNSEGIDGNTYYDLSPYENHGTLIGGSAGRSADSPFQESIWLDGSTANEIDCGSDASLKPPSAITVEGWFRHEDGGNGSTLRNALRYAYGYEIQERADYKWRFYLRTDSAGWLYAIDTINIVPGRWYYIAGTYDMADGMTRLYVDGLERGNHSRTAGDPINYTGNLTIGNDANNTRPWYGNIAGIRISNRAKPADEIRSYAYGF